MPYSSQTIAYVFSAAEVGMDTFCFMARATARRTTFLFTSSDSILNSGTSL